MAGIYDERILGAKQQAETARKLREGITSPQGQMVSGWYVAPSITQHLANALKTYSAGKQEREAMSEYERLRKQKEQETADIYAQMQARPQSVYSEEGPQQPFREPTERERMSALLRGVSVNPEAFQPQLQMAQYEMSQADKERARKEQMQFQREMQQERLDFQRQMAAQSAADRRSLAYGLAGMRQQAVKPLPAGALKMQQEGLEKIGVASSINADLGAVKSQIDSGKLNLGMMSNVINKARNAIGLSTEESQALSSFQSTLEKMRNDSLRLNSGVQTEGDAQRAWNELVANINDPKVVSRRLAEIQKINERGATLQQMQIDQVRENYGLSPLDVSGYRNVPSALGKNTTPKGARFLGFE